MLFQKAAVGPGKELMNRILLKSTAEFKERPRALLLLRTTKQTKLPDSRKTCASEEQTENSLILRLHILLKGLEEN